MGTIKKSSDLISDGPFGSNLKSEHYVLTGIRVLRLGNVGVGEFLDEDKAYISEGHYESLKKYTCRPGEIIIGTMGKPNLRACVIPQNITVSINKSDCVHLIPNPFFLNPQYVCAYLNSDSALNLAQKSLHGQTRSRISMSQVAELPIMLPPLPLQQKFAAFVHQVDATKAAAREEIATLETLRGKMMQEFFGGRGGV